MYSFYGSDVLGCCQTGLGCLGHYIKEPFSHLWTVSLFLLITDHLWTVSLFLLITDSRISPLSVTKSHNLNRYIGQSVDETILFYLSNFCSQSFSFSLSLSHSFYFPPPLPKPFLFNCFFTPLAPSNLFFFSFVSFLCLSYSLNLPVQKKFSSTGWFLMSVHLQCQKFSKASFINIA